MRHFAVERVCTIERIVAAALLVAVGACATPHPGSMAEAYRDPYEKTNRKLYAINKKLDHYALLPAAHVYRAVVPGAARHGVTNGFNNLGEPVSFINAVLQGKIKQAFRTVDRFMLNTVLGVGGLADVATDLGRPEEKEDFGQTFAVWGIKSGPYLMLPFFGPSTLRDGVGLGVEFAVDPVPYIRNAVIDWKFYYSVAEFGLKAVDLRSQLIDAGADGLLAGSLDEYATVRSAYLQHRQSQIYDGNPPDEDDMTPADAPLAPGGTRQPDSSTPQPPAAVPTTPVPSATDKPTAADKPAGDATVPPAATSADAPKAP
ncbi:VacJ family lipoprotein [Polymorphobacter sp. PAMC 29334]|uniref:MlaA family lipoprotein n=1 Tax=Polymorphobacter sp. PAMC 29334 TaxID=2862331 RepID=UPI001C799545|nr:VacJ family lipoprotein [Polymorphobacter sp. PAMC 29334]QYE34165.1 VacJ family lipoprotein [Polymorphobacter sp. PAMC 29334]